MSWCDLVDKHVEAVLDGEVDPSIQVDFDKHVLQCAACQERVAFAKAFRAHLRSALGRPAAPGALRRRAERLLEREAERPTFLPRVHTTWRGTGAVAVVATLLFVVGGAVQVFRPDQELQAGLPFAADLVHAHQAGVVNEVRRREAVPSFFKDRVNFPVSVPEFADPDVRFVGASYTHVAGRRAAALHYDVRGRRMTVVAFRSPLRVPAPLEQAVAWGRPVRYFRVGGHAVPVVEHQGTMYAVVGDMDGEDRLAMMARARLR